MIYKLNSYIEEAGQLAMRWIKMGEPRGLAIYKAAQRFGLETQDITEYLGKCRAASNAKKKVEAAAAKPREYDPDTDYKAHQYKD
jgi:hypothetical protein